MDPDSVDPRDLDEPESPDGTYRSAREDAWGRAAQAWADARSEDDPHRHSALVHAALGHETAWASERSRLDEDEASQVDAAP
jgi:hypothetical protein